ncbi:YqhG family protein [Brevibacillus sp. TJ4]|uniref:YqhG family protein n=1 Tax=Brevibacillus sp. TJ4 TaxID=3234853 RepID=UPI0037D7FD96
MQQQQIRQFVERYLAAFSAHVVETHPDYLTVKLPVEVDKDIGNRPFYWSWVEKMNLPYQPLVLTFAFDPERMPEGLRAEHLHLGAGRMQQIFSSTKKHGRFVCMYEQIPGFLPHVGVRRSIPLVPWLCLNMKISLLCDKKRDIMLSLGVNLHERQLVDDFVSQLYRLTLTPSIPDYYYTLDRRITLQQAQAIAEQEVMRRLQQEDQQWADSARTRLEEEWAILDAYYKELALREQTDEESSESGEEAVADNQEPEPSASAPPSADVPSEPTLPRQEAVEEKLTLDEHRAQGGRIIDFLRANTIPVTPREEINQQEWKSSTPAEEKKRRMEELRWQYEPRIQVELINGGLFYLHSPPGIGRIM